MDKVNVLESARLNSIKKLNDIKKYINILNECEICFAISKFGYLIKKIDRIKTVDYDGNLSYINYDKYNILNNNGDLVFDEWINEFSFEIRNNYCIIGINNSKYGVINEEGKIVIDPIYDKLYYDSDDIFMAKNNNKFGFVTSTGHLTPIIFSNASFFYDDLAAVRYNHKWGFISKATKITNPNNDMDYVIYPQYDEVDDFENGINTVKIYEKEEINDEVKIKRKKVLTIDKNNNILNENYKDY